MAKSNEPLVWAPFFAGAGLSALLMPVLIIITLVAGYGGLDANDLHALLANWFVRLVLFILISLSLFHAVHRIRYILVDLGLKAAKGLIAAVCYGSAMVGSVLAALLALGVF
jgi:fumarate reductase subunit D